MLLGAAHLVVAGRIDDVDQVEVSIADMTDQRRVQAGRLQVLLGLDDALGQPRDRPADVGRPALAAGPLCPRRIECGVPRLPQPRAILRPARQLAVGASWVRGHALHCTVPIRLTTADSLETTPHTLLA